MFQLKWLWRNLKGNRFLFIIGFICTVVTVSMIFINPQLTISLIDKVITPSIEAKSITAELTAAFWKIVILMIILNVIRFLIRYAMVICFEQSSQSMLLRLRQHLYQNLQQQNIEFYDKHRTGDLMTRLTGDLDLVRHTSSYVLYNLLDSFLLFIVTIIYLMTINTILTLSLIAVTPIIFFVTRKFSKAVKPKYVELRETLSDLNTVAQENIEGNRVVKAFAREDFEAEKFSNKNNKFRQSNKVASYVWLKFFPYIESVAQSMTFITILVGGLLVINDQLTLGQLVAFSSLTWALSNPMRMLGPLLNDFQRFLASANKVIEVYYAKPLIVNQPDSYVPKDKCTGKVEFRNVSFSYDKETVLNDISFTAESGQTIAIMGATGCGKTTIVNLISRFYDVSKGQILIDDVDIRKWSLTALRHSIGMATQEVFLFSDTIEGNIAYGNPDCSIDDVVYYANVSDADDFIRKTSNGYDTIIGERGVGLSGGQKQRIALARALATSPPILILDDTTSAVDLETEKYIQDQLSSLPFKTTKFIIAGRISSVKNADKIIILNDKKIVEMGTHEELLANKGYYSEIYSLQYDVDTFKEEGVV